MDGGRRKKNKINKKIISRLLLLSAVCTDDALSIEELLGDDRCQTTEQVTITVNDDNLHTTRQGEEVKGGGRKKCH